MNVEELRKARLAEPFVPFVIRRARGSDLRIDQPEFLAMSSEGRSVAVFSTIDNAFEILDTRMIHSLVFSDTGDPEPS